MGIIRVNSTVYSMSFTTGGLFLKESLRLAELFLQLEDWKLVKAKVFAENILQTRKLSTAQKIYQQTTYRIKAFNSEEMKFFISSKEKDQAYLLWVGTCRHYTFISDFAVEVLHERFVTKKKHIQNEDFDLFFADKAEWHPELERIKPSTRQKLRQVLFRMMREADLISSKKQITPALLSNELFRLLSQNDYRDLKVFPVFDSAVKGRT
ncbi:MAG: DUF1819 family protein [Candidatus Fermentibacteraceae bacterium]|nr:DUF1819 family protein [Candidatus Fermentibacteraceae bacterium]